MTDSSTISSTVRASRPRSRDRYHGSSRIPSSPPPWPNHTEDFASNSTDFTPPAPDADRADLIRSEERLHVSTRRVPIGKAVLRKVIVVEQRTITVEVAHEEVRLEYFPFDETVDVAPVAAHLALPDLVLHEEQVVITRRVVPTERVRARIVTVSEDRQVTEHLRREQVDLIGDTASA